MLGVHPGEPKDPGNSLTSIMQSMSLLPMLPRAARLPLPSQTPAMPFPSRDTFGRFALKMHM
jgi:hypothetical protein